jgi:anti-sigma factor RsiW
MKCIDVGEQLMDVASGQQAAPELAEHLRACSACAEHLESLRSTMALLDEWQPPEPSPYFDTRLSARLREEAARPRSWLVWLRKPALAAAMAVLLVIGGLLFRPAVTPQVVSQGQFQPGTAVGDLQELDKNHELLANFDLLDDISPDEAQAQSANP